MGDTAADLAAMAGTASSNSKQTVRDIIMLLFGCVVCCVLCEEFGRSSKWKYLVLGNEPTPEDVDNNMKVRTAINLMLYLVAPSE